MVRNLLKLLKFPLLNSPGVSHGDVTAQDNPSNNLSQDFSPSVISTSTEEFLQYSGGPRSRVELNLDDGSISSHIQNLSRSSIFTNDLWEPLSDQEDARLFQHYIDNLAGWVSITLELFFPLLILGSSISMTLRAISRILYLNLHYDALCY